MEHRRPGVAAGEHQPKLARIRKVMGIISAALWQRKFAAQPDVVGKSVLLDDKNYTIIGVLPADFALYRTSDVYALIGQWNAPPMRQPGRHCVVALFFEGPAA